MMLDLDNKCENTPDNDLDKTLDYTHDNTLLEPDQTQLSVSCQLSAIFHSWVAAKDILVWFHFLLVATKPAAGSW